MSTPIGKNVSALDTSAIQKAVGATVDGSFGPQTTQKVIDFQKANNLVPDGIVGAKTAAAITKLNAAPPPVNGNSVITSDNLKPVTTSVLPDVTEMPTDFNSPTYKADSASYMAGLIKKSSGEATAQADANTEMGVQKKKDTYNAIDLEMTSLDNNYNEAVKNIKLNNPGGTFGGALNQQLNDMTWKYQSQRATMGINKALATNDYNSAVEMANAKVKAEFQPIKDNIDNLIKFQAFNADNNAMTDKEKLLLGQKITQENAKYQSNIELGTYREKAKIDASIAASEMASYNTPSSTFSAPTTYITKPTDTGGLYQIAKDINLDFEALKAANPNLGADYKYTPGKDIINLPSVGNPNPTNVSILAATGLSSMEMNYMTQGQKALARMSEPTQKLVKARADAFARAHGTDTATIQSQYAAYNQVVEDKIKIAANTELAAKDISMSLDTLKTITQESGLGNVKIANVAKVWAGQQINDEKAAQYAFNLKDLQSAVAYFYYVQRGGSGSQGPSDSDMEDARKAVGNGLATGTITGLETTINKAASRYATIAGESVDVAKKAIWNLFDVGDQYKSSATTTKSDTVDTGNLWEDYKKKNGATSYSSPIDAINNWVMTPTI